MILKFKLFSILYGFVENTLPIIMVKFIFKWHLSILAYRHVSAAGDILKCDISHLDPTKQPKSALAPKMIYQGYN